MTGSPKTPFPERLLDGQDGCAELIREALTEHSFRAPPFEELVRRRLQRQIRLRMMATGVAMVACCWGMWQWDETPTLRISAESSFSSSVEQPGRNSEPAGSTKTPSKRPTLGEEGLLEAAPSLHATMPPMDENRSAVAARQRTPLTESTRTARLSEANSVDESRDGEAGANEAKTDLDCHLLTTSGHYTEARNCYDRVSRGSGIDAEVAWLERARLLARVDGDFDAARRTVLSYLSKFPNGNLRPEAEQMLANWERNLAPPGLRADRLGRGVPDM